MKKVTHPLITTNRDVNSESNSPCMNPASTIWPTWSDPIAKVYRQKTRRERIWAEGPVTILNANWRKEM